MYDAARSCVMSAACASRLTPYSDATAAGAIRVGTAFTSEKSAAIETKVVRLILSSHGPWRGLPSSAGPRIMLVRDRPETVTAGQTRPLPAEGRRTPEPEAPGPAPYRTRRQGNPP